MGIRQSAMGSHGCEFSKSIKQYDSFESDNPGDSFSGFLPKGTMVIETMIGSEEIGPADPENPNYDYFKAITEAESIAMARIESLAGKDVKQRYRISLNSQDEYDQIIVTATLIPQKHK